MFPQLRCLPLVLAGCVSSACGLIKVDTTVNGKKTTYGGGEEQTVQNASAAPAATAPKGTSGWGSAPVAAPAPQPAAQRVAHGSRHVAAPTPATSGALPSVQDVNEHFRSPPEREAAHKTIGDYVAFRRISAVEGPGMHPTEQQRHSNRERELEDAARVARNSKNPNDTLLSSGAQALYDDPDFQLRAVSTVVSPHAAAEFQHSRSFQQTALRAQHSAQNKATEAILARAARHKHPGVDRTVFGIELGTAVVLPRCSNEMTDAALVSGMLGGSAGVKETCFGDAAGDIALSAMQLGAKAAGLRSVQSQIQQVSIKLADDSCPDWVRMPGRCTLFVQHVAGVALGATITVMPFSDAEAIIKPQLTQKYGKAPAKGETSSCVNTWSGAEIARMHQHVWALPGMTVVYDPMGFGNCQQGIVRVELAMLNEIRAAEQAEQDAKGPKM